LVGEGLVGTSFIPPTRPRSIRAFHHARECRIRARTSYAPRLGRGHDLSEVEPYREAVSYSEENTFAADVSDRRLLESAIGTHADSVARRLRRDGVAARTVVLKLKLGRRVAPGPRGFPLLTRRTTLPEPCDDGPSLARAACRLLDRAAPLEPVRLLGVGATGIAPRDAQPALFAAPRAAQRRERLNRALDQIAERFGEDAVVRGEPEHTERAGLSLQIKRGARSERAGGGGRQRGRPPGPPDR
jgi:nucleotidyltransferase/DNA polymerase involved in DNA repair